MPWKQDEGQNIYVYHEVFADVLKQIFQAILQKDEAIAKELVISAIIYAGGINGIEYEREELKEKKLDKLIYEMVQEQKKAGLIPLQKFDRESYYKVVMQRGKSK